MINMHTNIKIILEPINYKTLIMIGLDFQEEILALSIFMYGLQT